MNNINNEITDVLKKVYNKLEENNIFWILSGSVSLAIQGVDVTPNKDIDILTDKDGSNAIYSILKEYCIQQPSYSGTEKYRSYFGIYNIDNVQVEVMGNFQYKLKDNTWSKENHLHTIHKINYEEMILPVLSLKQELKEYKNLDRYDKVEKIEKALN